MYECYRHDQFEAYSRARSYFISNFPRLIAVEELLFTVVREIIISLKDEIKRDYDEASYLFPFWQNYPPEARGRQPIGDQFPWIEVGENVIGSKLSRQLRQSFAIRDTGIPSGPDERYLLSDDRIRSVLGITCSAWLFVDIKSVGPRDDEDHAVMSHNQISGDGLWEDESGGVRNTPIWARGKRRSHLFYCAIPPLYVLSDGTIAPVVHVVIKPVYDMLSLKPGRQGGQPLQRIDLASIPNGLLLTTGPQYLKQYPGLFFPGKDDRDKAPTKVRARVAFEPIRDIAHWRFCSIRV